MTDRREAFMIIGKMILYTVCEPGTLTEDWVSGIDA